MFPVNFVFLASLTCIYLLFIQLAKKWPRFLRHWEQVEKQGSIFGHSKNLSKKINKLVAVIMLLALGKQFNYLHYTGIENIDIMVLRNMNKKKTK